MPNEPARRNLPLEPASDGVARLLRYLREYTLVSVRVSRANLETGSDWRRCDEEL